MPSGGGLPARGLLVLLASDSVTSKDLTRSIYAQRLHPSVQNELTHAKWSVIAVEVS